MKSKCSDKDTILIVDDIQENVSVLYRFLSDEGFKTLVAKNGEQVLKLLKFARPDIILLDVMMPPGIDGFEVCKILKSQEETQEIPIIFMTALTETIDKVKGFKLGAADYITKPFQQEEILARINAHLKITQLQQELQTKNEKLQQQTVELETRNLELEAFCRSVAHDLKNPINVVKGYTEMLISDYPINTSVDEEAIEVLDLTNQANDKMINIIDSLLLLAGVARDVDVPIQPLDMSVIISQVIQQRLTHLLKKYQGEIAFNPNSTDIAKNSWPTAQGYAPWVEEIWANYLSNALKYGGRPPYLELGAHSQEDGTIRFWVRDNGPGLSKDAQNKLFTPFTRLHTDRAEGHGLGLSIVQQIIEKLGGKVGVESTLGQGSRFYFTLPGLI
ncbi:MAG: response regulator [Candidatus Parabeggiatoa sp.]|nr:response regulator [Candidatus Parabeggiatoa sp.]